MGGGLPAQVFDGLATTTDGAVLYFTSPLDLKTGSGPAGAAKIFRAHASTVELAVRPMCTVTPAPPNRECGLQFPQVSGDGRVLAYTFREYDLTGTRNITQGHIEPNPFFDRTVDGYSVRLSRNGRWALGVPDIQFGTPQFLDLSTGGATILTGFTVIGDALQSLADDGSVLLHDGPQNTVLWKGGTASRLQLAHQSGNARIDRDARTIVYEWIDSQYHLNSYDIASGVDRELWSEGIVPPTFRPFAVASALHYSPSIADNGRSVLVQAAYRAGREVWILATDGTTARQLTSGGNVSSVVLSGDGVIAYAATFDNRILRVNTVTVERSEVVPPTPAVTPGTTAPEVAPGDFATVGGSGLDHALVLVNKEPAWVIGAHNGNAAFRIPWDVPVGQTVQITVAGDSPFVSAAVAAHVAASVPHPWISLPIHQDFSDFVMPGSPAKPGEAVHLYMTGLGITDPLLPLDQPAPVGLLVRAVTPLTCSLGSLDAPVLFAGTAPGQTWIYQADVLIPPAAPALSNGTLHCGAAAFPIAVAQQ